MAYLIDTNVLCESSKPSPDPSVIQWLADHDAQLYVSVLSLGAMLKGIHLLDAGKRRHDIEHCYQRIERWAANRILSLDAAVMTTWGRLYAEHQRNGRKLLLPDCLLAATARHYQLTIITIITRNTSDFPADMPMLNP